MGYPPEFWERVQADYETGRYGQAKLAKMYGVSAKAVSYQIKKNGWVKGDIRSAAEDAEAVLAHSAVTTEPPPTSGAEEATITFAEPASTTSTVAVEEEEVPVDSNEQRIAELEAKLAEAEQRAAAAEEETRRYDPRVDVPHMATLEDYIEHVGWEDLKELALSHLGRENIKRHREGKPPLEFGDDRIEATVAEIVQKRIRGIRSSVREEDNMRVIKMVKPSGTMTQVPVETQINNEAGQQGAAVWKARDKQYKIASPYRCQRHNCWELAAVSESGQFLLDGYCSPEHRAQDPYLNTAPVAGTSVSGMGMKSSRDAGRADRFLAGTG